MIFSFTLWNNCLSIVCITTSSSPEKWAILCKNQTPTPITPGRRQGRALRTRAPTPPRPVRYAVPRETAASAWGWVLSAACASFRETSHLTLGKHGSSRTRLMYLSLPAFRTNRVQVVTANRKKDSPEGFDGWA